VNLLTRRAAVLLASLAISVAMLTGPAAASTTSYEADSELGYLPTLVLFLGAPVALFLLIWLLVVARQLVRRSKQQNDLSWFRDMAGDDDTDETPALSAPAPAGQLANPATQPRAEPVGEPSGSTRVTPNS
jgi:hypothetical protein